MAARPAFASGAGVVTIDDALRVRSGPEVSDLSVRYEPTLPRGTELHVVAGPVAGSGYWWYQVELPDGVTLYHGIREGWIAAAARDGTPWIDAIADVDCYEACPPPPSPTTGWPTVRRADIALTGDVIGDADPDMRGNFTVKVAVRGLLPGSTVTLDAEGAFEMAWVCYAPLEEAPASIPPLGWGVETLGRTQGTATAAVDHVAVDADGAATATLVLRPAQPVPGCAARHSGPHAWSGQWAKVRIADRSHALALTPEGTNWDTTI